MKKSLLLLSFAFLIATLTNAQTIELVYFKANLPCCHARSCNQLENQIKSIVETKYDKENLAFRTVRITNPDNEELVKNTMQVRKQLSLKIIMRLLT